jgi:polyferredoxin
MVTFLGTLMVGAVAGWMLEQNVGQQILRWSRNKRMKMRVLRRQGVSPLRAWRFDEE